MDVGDHRHRDEDWSISEPASHAAPTIRRAFRSSTHEVKKMMKICKGIVPLAIMGLVPFAVHSQTLPGKHPGYLHSLSDLRASRWFLYHQPGDSAVSGDEDVAITQIDAAINEIKRASIDDGKDLNDHPPVDIKEHGSRLLKAIETLKKAHGDIDHEEDKPEVRELRHRALEHIDKAIHAADAAHTKWLQQMHK
jgi:hypothetical protein